MYQVKCTKCGKIREVKARKPWMTGEPPYQKICVPCSQKGKVKSEEHKRKLSNSVKAAQTKELLEKKSQFMQSHPELWVIPRPDLAKEAWTGQHHSEETKEKISEAMTGREVPLEVREKISKTMKEAKNESE
jgi:hypothetical protein